MTKRNQQEVFTKIFSGQWTGAKSSIGQRRRMLQYLTTQFPLALRTARIYPFLLWVYLQVSFATNSMQIHRARRATVSEADQDTVVRKCPKGKVPIEYSMCTTDTCIDAGCYTPKRRQYLLGKYWESMCLNGGNYVWPGNGSPSYGYAPKWVNHRCEGHWFVGNKEVSHEEYIKLTGEKF